MKTPKICFTGARCHRRNSRFIRQTIQGGDALDPLARDFSASTPDLPTSTCQGRFIRKGPTGLPHPLWILGRPVVYIRRLETLKSPRHCHLPRLGPKRAKLRFRQRLECPRRLQRLLQPLHALAPVDHYRGRQAERVVQAFDRAHQAATWDLPVHRQNTI
jgi:hypothetical protein